MSRWFRFYDGVLDDPKVMALPPLLFKFWVKLLCVASRYDGKLPMKDLPFLMRESEDQVGVSLHELISRGLLDDIGEEVEPHNWDKRQFKSDVSTERVKRYRERECNGDETVSETPPETEQNRTEKKDISRKKTDREKTTDEFDPWYDAYPLHKGRGAALRAYKTARGKAETDVLLTAAKYFAKKCLARADDPKFIPHPATWLNQERWLDDDLQPAKAEPVVNPNAYRAEVGSNEWAEWDRWLRLAGKRMPNPVNGHWTFPDRWPPDNVSRQTSEAA